jgi:cell division protease FtsH
VGNMRNVAFWVVLLVLAHGAVPAFHWRSDDDVGSQEMSYSEFVQRVDAGQVAAVTLDGERITVGQGRQVQSMSPSSRRARWSPTSLSRDLIAKGIEVEAEPQAQSGSCRC